MTFESHQQARVSKYIARPTIRRPPLKATLDVVVASLPDTVIFGGMLRDLALGGARRFSSDIDLVTLAKRDEIQKVTEKWTPVVNKFGGFRFVVGHQRFDIWCLTDTWAFQAGILQGAVFHDLLATSFFNLDAVYFHLRSGKLMYADGFEGGVTERLLDINLEANPHPERMARRALSLVLNHGLDLTHRLAIYVAKHVNRVQLMGSESLLVGAIDSFLRDSGEGVFKYRPQLQFG